MARRILLSGGGTGGHITPILALAHELKQLDPDCQIIYIGERGGKFAHLTAAHQSVNEIHAVYAGKFRRYHGESWFRRLTDFNTIFLNIRDLFYVSVGCIQSYFLLGKLKPEVVFLKGGFTGVPIGIAAAIRHIPIITHDSDAMPGLANRIVSRWAKMHATALPANYYNYPPGKVRHVGVLVEPSYKPVTPQMQIEYKKTLQIPEESPLVVITGGSSGAERINKAVAGIIDQLLNSKPNLHVIHQVGKGKGGVYEDYIHDRLHVYEFLQPMHEYLGAADLVVARSSANTLAELGVQGKACIAIPNHDLTGGHQLKNAELLSQHNAAMVLSEKELYEPQHGLLSLIVRLLDDADLRQQLAGNLKRLTIPDAASQLASLIISFTDKNTQK